MHIDLQKNEKTQCRFMNFCLVNDFEHFVSLKLLFYLMGLIKPQKTQKFLQNVYVTSKFQYVAFLHASKESVFLCLFAINCPQYKGKNTSNTMQKSYYFIKNLIAPYR